MSSMVLVLATAVACAPVASGFSLKNIQLKPSIAQILQHQTLVAQKYGGSDPHGDDPHGGDPHDENHDDKLPANAHRDDQKAPRDVYGGTVPNGQAPY
ncbi:MAG TPA: hypothetical protein V6C76_10760 [Drouetiella sp.]